MDVIADLGYEHGFWAKVIDWHGSEKIVVKSAIGWVFPLESVEVRDTIVGDT